MKIRCGVCYSPIGQSRRPDSEIEARDTCCFDSNNWEVDPVINGLYGSNQTEVFLACKEIWEPMYSPRKLKEFESRQAQKLFELAGV